MSSPNPDESDIQDQPSEAEVNAQKEEEVPKELLLSSLNSVAHLKIENDQITSLMDYNKGFVDEVYTILDSGKDDKYIKKSLQNLHEKRETDLREIMGKGKTNNYLEHM